MKWELSKLAYEYALCVDFPALNPQRALDESLLVRPSPYSRVMEIWQQMYVLPRRLEDA